MKNLLVITLIGTSSAATLCHAASVQHQQSKVIQNEDTTIFNVLPTLANEGSTSTALISHYGKQSYEQVLAEKIASNVKSMGCESSKRNDVYELTALFNDKLQMLLSYFDKKTPNQPYEVVENKDSINVDSVTRS